MKTMEFRKDINGLRAWAVSLVVLYHIGIPLFRGGFIGVDIFFVISGFLMTGIVLGGLTSDREGEPFSITRFYVARARRILPALAGLCASLLVFGWFFLIPSEYEKLGVQIAKAMLFISNHAFRKGDYFTISSQENWVLHTWSLAVEWQFYLAFPILLLATWKRRPRIGFLWRVIAIAFFLSLAYSLALSFKRPIDAFYLFPSRAWEMLAGGLVYLAASRRSRLAFDRTRMEKLGLAALLIAALALDKTRSWPGLWALIPVCGTAAILLANRADSPWTSNSVCQWLGTRSYSIYLWHWPIVIALRHFEFERTPLTVVLCLVLTALLGHISYVLTEKRPGEYLAKKTKSAATILLAASGMIVILSGLAINHGHGFPSRLPAALQGVSTFHFDRTAYFRSKSCFIEPDQTALEFEKCVPDGNVASDDIVLLWGDSFAAHLYPGIMRHMPSRLTLIQMTAARCPPILGASPATSPHCKDDNAAVLNWIRERKPGRIILAGQWLSHDWMNLSKTLEELKQLGIKRIDLVGPAPVWRKPLPSTVLYDAWRRGGSEAEIATRTRHNLKNHVGSVDQNMRTFAETMKIGYISPFEILCTAEGCLTFVGEPTGENLTAWDDGHMTAKASEYVVSKFPAW